MNTLHIISNISADHLCGTTTHLDSLFYPSPHVYYECSTGRVPRHYELLAQTQMGHGIENVLVKGKCLDWHKLIFESRSKDQNSIDR